MREYEAQKQRDLERWLYETTQGNVSKAVMVQPQIVPKKGEEVFVSLINISLVEPRFVREYQAGRRGVSLRVAKGVSVHVGGIKGKSESHEELRVIDSGNIVVTNKRIVFIGAKRTTNINMNKVISIDPFIDGIGVSRQGKQKREYFLIDQNLFDMQIAVDGRFHKVPFSGHILMALITGASRYSSPEPPTYRRQEIVKKVKKVEEVEEAEECPSWGAIVPTTAKFCLECGNKLR